MNNLRAALVTPVATEESSIWYSGLVIEPTEFSNQLARLQVSLQGSSAPMEAPVNMPVLMNKI